MQGFKGSNISSNSNNGKFGMNKNEGNLKNDGKMDGND